MKVIKGDLISLFQNGEFDVIVHGCNAHCTMGSGIARSIREAYPIAYEVDCQTKKGDRSKLGSFTVASVVNPMNKEAQYIINAYTQYDYNPRVLQVDYKALRRCFKNIKSAYSGKRIAYPAIGCGLAGGDWNVVSKIIDEELAGEDHTFVIYQK